MSQELKLSSGPQTLSSTTTYKCCECGTDIVDHVYQVQRRRIRPLREVSETGKVKHNVSDALDGSHAGVILGPEYDLYCPTCYADIPTIQELINKNKGKLKEMIGEKL